MFRILWSIVCNAFHRHLKPNIVYITCGRPSNADLQQWYNDQPKHQQQLECFTAISDQHSKLVGLMQTWLRNELHYDTERRLYGGSTEVRNWERETGPAALRQIEEFAESSDQLALAHRLVQLASAELILSQHERVIDFDLMTEHYKAWSKDKNSSWPYNVPMPV